MSTDPHADDRIPFNLPAVVGRELDYIAEAIQGGKLGGNGTFTQRCQDVLRNTYGGEQVLLTTSCTTALEMAALLCEIGPGDEVILPSFTFVSTANAFHLRGATLRFVDIRPDTLNMDETLVAEQVTKRTRAICAVHYASVGCEMDVLMRLAKDTGTRLIEDAAQGLGATYRDQYLGTIGHLGAYSFHETKNFISGEGGAIVVNDPALCERAEILAEKGTDRARFFRGQVDKYTWQDIGSSYYPSELVAAFLYAQLENAETITAHRLAAWQTYWDGLEPLANAGLFHLPFTPADCAHNAHMFYVLTRSAEERTALLAHLHARRITAVFHFVPLHNSPMGQRLGYDDRALPVTDDVSARLIRLPMYHQLTEETQQQVIDAVSAFYNA